MLIGINNIKLVHLNDSHYDVGERRDRHDNLGEGFIGIDSLIKIATFFTNLGVPLILETYKTCRDIKLVREYII